MISRMPMTNGGHDTKHRNALLQTKTVEADSNKLISATIRYLLETICHECKLVRATCSINDISLTYERSDGEADQNRFRRRESRISISRPFTDTKIGVLEFAYFGSRSRNDRNLIREAVAVLASLPEAHCKNSLCKIDAASSTNLFEEIEDRLFGFRLKAARHSLSSRQSGIDCALRVAVDAGVADCCRYWRVDSKTPRLRCLIASHQIPSVNSSARGTHSREASPLCNRFADENLLRSIDDDGLTGISGLFVRATKNVWLQGKLAGQIEFLGQHEFSGESIRRQLLLAEFLMEDLQSKVSGNREINFNARNETKNSVTVLNRQSDAINIGHEGRVIQSKARLIIDHTGRIIHANPSALALLPADDQATPPSSLDGWLQGHDAQAVSLIFDYLRESSADPQRSMGIYKLRQNRAWLDDEITSVHVVVNRLDNNRGVVTLDRINTSNADPKPCVSNSLNNPSKLEQLSSTGYTSIADLGYAGLFHDIRNSLVLAFANAELGAQEVGWDSQAHHYFEVILKSVERAIELSNQLLIRERARHTKVEADLSKVVQEVFSSMRAQNLSNIDFESQIEPIPPLRLSEAELYRILMNLLSNAVNALDTVGGKVTLRATKSVEKMSAESNLPFVRIRIADNGPGISPTIKDHLFEVRADQKSPEHGLGLAIVDQLVIAAGGWIELCELDAPGACFDLYLPCQES